MKLAKPLKQSDIKLGLALLYWGEAENPIHSPFPYFLLPPTHCFFLPSEWVKSVNKYLWSAHRIAEPGRRWRLLEEAQDSSHWRQ